MDVLLIPILSPLCKNQCCCRNNTSIITLIRFNIDDNKDDFPNDKVIKDRKRRCDRKKLDGLAFNLLKQTLKKSQ